MRRVAPSTDAQTLRASVTQLQSTWRQGIVGMMRKVQGAVIWPGQPQEAVSSAASDVIEVATLIWGTTKIADDLLEIDACICHAFWDGSFVDIDFKRSEILTADANADGVLDLREWHSMLARHRRVFTMVKSGGRCV